jgi:hypothetical protein
MFLILIFKTLYYLKMCQIFVGSVHNFDRFDDDMSDLLKKCLFQIYEIEFCFHAELAQTSWTLSIY